MSTLPMPANLDQRPHPEPHRPGAALILLLVGPACLTGSYKPDEVVTATETTFSSSTSSSTLPGQPTTTTASTTPTGFGSESGIDSEASSSPTTPDVCGDGALDPGEECDDGNQTPGDGCENDCTETLSSCGDGIVDFKEDCDDGNDVNTDDCVSCTTASCGDGHVQAGVEECDNGDGNDESAYDGCTTQCAPGPRCGDGMVNGPEECDDANQTDDDDCSNDCITSRLVFVTSGGFNGNLGGLAGADNLCKATAGALGMPTAQWRAWLSDGTNSPSTRMDTKFTGHYKLVNGTSIARGWDDLTDGTLAAAVNVTESGETPLDLGAAWTNTGSDGTIADAMSHCANWTVASDVSSSVRGSVAATNAAWTINGTSICATAFRIYCFQHTVP